MDPKFYGDQLVIKAMSYFFGWRITVVHCNTLSQTTFRYQKDLEDTDIVMVYNDVNHYNSMHKLYEPYSVLHKPYPFLHELCIFWHKHVTNLKTKIFSICLDSVMSFEDGETGYVGLGQLSYTARFSEKKKREEQEALVLKHFVSMNCILLCTNCIPFCMNCVYSSMNNMLSFQRPPCPPPVVPRRTQKDKELEKMEEKMNEERKKRKAMEKEVNELKEKMAKFEGDAEKVQKIKEVLLGEEGEGVPPGLQKVKKGDKWCNMCQPRKRFEHTWQLKQHVNR